MGSQMSSSVLLNLDGLALLIDPETGRVGSRSPGQSTQWSEQCLPLPVRAVLTDADVGYLHMWSGVLEVQRPSGHTCWLVDGEDQPVRVHLFLGQSPSLSWP